jgi:hypothetical protein
MADMLQLSRRASPRGRAAFKPPPMPRLVPLSPKLSKAFPDDVRAIQDGLDSWWGNVEAQLRNALDSQDSNTTT